MSIIAQRDCIVCGNMPPYDQWIKLAFDVHTPVDVIHRAVWLHATPECMDALERACNSVDAYRQEQALKHAPTK